MPPTNSENTVNLNLVMQMAGWASVLAMVGGLALWPLYQADARHEERLNKQDERHGSHVNDGHPLRFSESIDANIVAVNERNRVLQNQLDALEKQMQILNQQERERSERANNWIDSVGVVITKTLSAMQERLSAIEQRQGVKPE